MLPEFVKIGKEGNPLGSGLYYLSFLGEWCDEKLPFETCVFDVDPSTNCTQILTPSGMFVEADINIPPLESRVAIGCMVHVTGSAYCGDTAGDSGSG